MTIPSRTLIGANCETSRDHIRHCRISMMSRSCAPKNLTISKDPIPKRNYFSKPCLYRLHIIVIIIIIISIIHRDTDDVFRGCKHHLQKVKQLANLMAFRWRNDVGASLTWPKTRRVWILFGLLAMRMTDYKKQVIIFSSSHFPHGFLLKLFLFVARFLTPPISLNTWHELGKPQGSAESKAGFGQHGVGLQLGGPWVVRRYG